MFVYFTAKFIWPPLKDTINLRKTKIEEGLYFAFNAKQDVYKSCEIADSIIEKAKRESLRIIENASEEALRISNNAKDRSLLDAITFREHFIKDVNLDRLKVENKLKKRFGRSHYFSY